MSVVYNFLIDKNVTPTNADKIGVYNSSNEKVIDIDIPSSCKLDITALGTKLYSFGCISDVHITSPTAQEDYRIALQYFAQEQVDFITICGDLTQNGTTEELSTWVNFTNNYHGNVPVYAMTGNHEGRNSDIESIISTYTGHPLYYEFTQGNDVFIMFGCKADTTGILFTEAGLKWLYEKLENHRNQRVFLLQHVRPDDASGNAFGIYGSDIWSGDEQLLFEAFLRHYTNVTLFHGHSHLKFYLQYGSSTANYDTVFGINSIHIPSLSVPRDGDASGASSATYIYADSEGYIVDVYETAIVLKGRDFADSKFLPIALYKIDTPLTTIAQGTFVNPTSIPLTDITATGITLNKSTSTGNVGGTETLTYTLTPSNANIYNVTWSTSDSTVATVNDGVVTFVGEGTATITATETNSNSSDVCVYTITQSGGGETLPTYVYDDVITNVSDLNLGLRNTSNWESNKAWSGSAPYNISGGTTPSASTTRASFKPYVKLPSGSYTIGVTSTDNSQIYVRDIYATGAIAGSSTYSDGDTYTTDGTHYLKILTNTDATFGDSTGVTEVTFTEIL
ncbi:MAG: metallophosphoesterase [Lachnospiraceae bacterium]|nr:metallophosphoesterase [Lachnospiraceae bacterium]